MLRRRACHDKPRLRQDIHRLILRLAVVHFWHGHRLFPLAYGNRDRISLFDGRPGLWLLGNHLACRHGVAVRELSVWIKPLLLKRIHSRLTVISNDIRRLKADLLGPRADIDVHHGILAHHRPFLYILGNDEALLILLRRLAPRLPDAKADILKLGLCGVNRHPLYGNHLNLLFLFFLCINQGMLLCLCFRVCSLLFGG